MLSERVMNLLRARFIRRYAVYVRPSFSLAQPQLQNIVACWSIIIIRNEMENFRAWSHSTKTKGHSVDTCRLCVGDRNREEE